MKKTAIMAFAAAAMLFLVGCGSSSSTADTSDDGRLITGEISTDASAMLVKAEDASGCVGEICGIVAYGSDGSEVQGEIDPETYRWRIRVRAGNWMFGFLDGSGQRLGYLTMNGMTAVTVEEGDDIDVGQFRHRNGRIEQLDDVAELGQNGVHSYYHQDADRDGIPADFDDDEAAMDTNLFGVLFVRPYDGQPHVAPCRPVKVVFTKPIDDASVSSDTMVVKQADGTAIEGVLSVWEDAEYQEYEVTFAPSGGFPMGETISLLVVSGEGGVISEEGEALAQDVKTSFTVRDWGSTSDACHESDGEMQQLREEEREQERIGQQ